MELLFVVVILAVLVGIAIASFVVATDKAEVAACRANTRVLQNAVVAYQAANDGAFPDTLDDVDDYVMAPNVYDCCPGDSSTELIYDNTTGRVTCPDHP